jgi:uncharacterized protein YhbP (UPF0306 family)
MERQMNDPDLVGTEAGLLREYVVGGKLMQVSTVASDGAPWLAHCWYAPDKALRLVFLSRGDRRHSQNILQDARVAGGIVTIPLEGLGQKIRGVTFEGIAECVSDADLDGAYATYQSRWPQVHNMVTPEDIRADVTPNRFWRIVVQTYVLFDEVTFGAAPRREIGQW